MARQRDWTDPWSNPLGEILASIIGRLPLRPDDRTDEDWDHHQPVPEWSGLRFCATCGTGTLHIQHFWRLEEETTIECTRCDGVWWDA